MEAEAIYIQYLYQFFCIRGNLDENNGGRVRLYDSIFLGKCCIFISPTHVYMYHMHLHYLHLVRVYIYTLYTDEKGPVLAVICLNHIIIKVNLVITY